MVELYKGVDTKNVRMMLKDCAVLLGFGFSLGLSLSPNAVA